jgi:hypothetical protein
LVAAASAASAIFHHILVRDKVTVVERWVAISVQPAGAVWAAVEARNITWAIIKSPEVNPAGLVIIQVELVLLVALVPTLLNAIAMTYP